MMVSSNPTRELRNTLGMFATGVAIITTKYADQHIGATISSFNSISLNPPLVSFSIAREAKAFEPWSNTEHFCVSVLEESQIYLAKQFAQSLGDKWSGTECSPCGEIDAQMIEGALAWLECERYRLDDGGDHVTIIGRILKATRNPDGKKRPLVFFGGAFHGLALDVPI
jgi:flavin reductase (DIM6/NTAB) family NADH-FMN oxidoreductase RutF